MYVKVVLPTIMDWFGSFPSWCQREGARQQARQLLLRCGEPIGSAHSIGDVMREVRAISLPAYVKAALLALR
jgi:hypothetical protein